MYIKVEFDELDLYPYYMYILETPPAKEVKEKETRVVEEIKTRETQPA
jgi:hypothetical protein